MPRALLTWLICLQSPDMTNDNHVVSNLRWFFDQQIDLPKNKDNYKASWKSGIRKYL